jgi:hypothetical protein
MVNTRSVAIILISSGAVLLASGGFLVAMYPFLQEGKGRCARRFSGRRA